MLPHILTNFEVEKYHQNERKYNGVYSRNNIPKINYYYWAYVLKLDECKSIGTH